MDVTTILRDVDLIVNISPTDESLLVLVSWLGSDADSSRLLQSDGQLDAFSNREHMPSLLHLFVSRLVVVFVEVVEVDVVLPSTISISKRSFPATDDVVEYTAVDVDDRSSCIPASLDDAMTTKVVHAKIRTSKWIDFMLLEIRCCNLTMLQLTSGAYERNSHSR